MAARLESSPRPYRKVLWAKQPYPDNYQDETFLAAIKRNHGSRSYSYWALVLDYLPVVAHLSSVVTFAIIFAYLYLDLIRAQELIWLSTAIGLCGYGVWERGDPARALNRWPTLRSAGVLLFLLLLLSPVMRTLTLSTSEDSIWKLSAYLLLGNVLLGDYSSSEAAPAETRLPSALSLNAATFAAVVLASRLDSNASVFALVLFSIEWFALFPIMRREVLRRHPGSVARPVVLTASLCILTCLLLLPLSVLLAGLYVVLVPVGTTLLVPASWLAVQSLKNNLTGPWDCVEVPEVLLEP